MPLSPAALADATSPESPASRMGQTPGGHTNPLPHLRVQGRPAAKLPSTSFLLLLPRPCACLLQSTLALVSRHDG